MNNIGLSRLKLKNYYLRGCAVLFQIQVAPQTVIMTKYTYPVLLYLSEDDDRTRNEKKASVIIIQCSLYHLTGQQS